MAKGHTDAPLSIVEIESINLKTRMECEEQTNDSFSPLSPLSCPKLEEIEAMNLKTERTNRQTKAPLYHVWNWKGYHTIVKAN